MKINYNNRKFRLISNSDNGEVSSEMNFHYHQKNNILTCQYKGENITIGHLLGIVNQDGSIDIRYHQINTKGKIMTGVCRSKPELSIKGKIRLHEKWHWTSGDKSEGISILEEV